MAEGSSPISYHSMSSLSIALKRTVNSSKADRTCLQRQVSKECFYGNKLVNKVCNDLSILKVIDTECAWGVNLRRVKQEIEDQNWNTTRSSWVAAECHKNDEVPCTSGRRRRGVKPTKIYPVERRPPMIYWTKTPINIPTPDSKFLTHMPFFGDEFEKRDKNGNFGEELLEMYSWQMNTTDSPVWEKLPETLNLIEFIRVIMEISNDYGRSVFSEEHKTGTMELPTAVYLDSIYDQVKNAAEDVYDGKKPSKKSLAAVCRALFPEIEPEELRKCYVESCQKRNADFNKPKLAPSNIDLVKVTKVYSKEVQMDSYASLFCRLCYQYSCPQHELLMSRDEIEMMQGVVKLQREINNKSKAKRKAESWKCEFEKCCRNVAREGIPSSPGNQDRETWAKLLPNWTPTEMTAFNCLYGSFKDYCVVASLILTKTCREVMNYHLSEPMDTSCIDDDEIGLAHCSRSHPSPSCSNYPSTLSSSGYDSFSSSSGNLTADIASDDQTISRELSTFIPCVHKNGICDSSCKCVMGKKRCETACACFKTCKNRFRGCVCKTTCDTKMCPCYIANRECDPDLCKGCGSHEIDVKKVTCQNVALQRKSDRRKPIYIKKSRVSGWGAFAGVNIRRGEFIDEYTAEVISGNEAERRGHIYDHKNHTFLFGLDENINLDASILGNECRFINSSKRPNCQPVRMYVRGERRLAIRALKDIPKDDELFMNYHQVLKQNSKMKGNGRKRSSKYIDE